MPELDERTTRTTEETIPDDAAKGAEGSGAPAAEGSGSEAPSAEDRIAELERKNAQLLSERTRYEETQRENEQLKRDRTKPDPPVTRDDANGRALLEQDLQFEAEIMAGVQPTLEHFQAKTRLDRYRHELAMTESRRLTQRVEVVKLPDDLREEAEKLAQEEGISVKLAARLVRAERGAQAKAEETDTDDERTKLATAKRDATPRTTSRAVGAGEAATITSAEYRRRLAKFDDDGDIGGKAALVRQKNEKKIRVSG